MYLRGVKENATSHLDIFSLLKYIEHILPKESKLATYILINLCIISH